MNPSPPLPPRSAAEIPLNQYVPEAKQPSGADASYAQPSAGLPLLVTNVTGCSVCQQNYLPNDHVKMLGCQHVFHASCADRWLQGELYCPSCRAQVLFPTAQPVMFHEAQPRRGLEPLQPVTAYYPNTTARTMPLDGTDPTLYGQCRDCQRVFYRTPGEVQPETSAWYRCANCRGTDIVSLARASCAIQ